MARKLNSTFFIHRSHTKSVQRPFMTNREEVCYNLCSLTHNGLLCLVIKATASMFNSLSTKSLTFKSESYGNIVGFLYLSESRNYRSVVCSL